MGNNNRETYYTYTYRLIFMKQLPFGLIQQNIIGEDRVRILYLLRTGGHSSPLLCVLVFVYVVKAMFYCLYYIGCLLFFGPRLGEDKATISWGTDLT